MVLRGLVEHHARSLLHLGATAASIESITGYDKRKHSCELLRGTNPNENTRLKWIKKERRCLCRDLLAPGTQFSLRTPRARHLMNDDTWPYSLNRRRIKRSRKKMFLDGLRIEQCRVFSSLNDSLLDQWNYNFDRRR